ncbi:MAG: hypothetical protein CMJ58_18170 [Planctomycetaceae bacterium]|nr:hypothetical protein [Planctomycetaceae bacterium]
MTQQHAICLIVDGLRASALGAYGAAWAPTPACDVLAAESILHDRLWCDSPTLAGFYRAAWTGRHAAARLSIRPEGAPSLPRLLGDAGIAVHLVTDDEQLPASIPGDAQDVAGVLLESGHPTAPAAATESTAMYQFFAAAAEEIARGATQRSGQRRLWWLHCRGFSGAWDAPTVVRDSLWSDDELAPPTFVESPLRVATDDPDDLLAHRVTYAAQATVLDQCVGDFLAAIDDLGLGETALVMLAGARGFALGEHGETGAAVDALFGERLHVPWLMRPGRDDAPRQRRSDLTQPQALLTSICEWFGVDAGVHSQDRVATAALGEDGEWALLTDEWLLRMPPAQGDEPCRGQLFSKPDDRWEANEVADRCPDEVAALLAAAAAAGLPVPAAVD